MSDERTPRLRPIAAAPFPDFPRSAASIRADVRRGRYAGYKVPGLRGLLIDVDEARAAIDALPASQARLRYGCSDPTARIITLAAERVSR